MDTFRGGQITKIVGSIYNDIKVLVFIPGALQKWVTSIVAVLFRGSNWTIFTSARKQKKNIPLGFLLGLLCPRLSQLKASPLAA